VHEEFLTRMMDMSRRLVDMGERLSGHTEGSQASSSDSGAVEFGILVVDGDGTLADLLEANVDKEGYTVRWAATGGEAFDMVGQGGIQLALVQRQLPDLPGSMVVHSIKQLASDTIVLEVAAPGDTPGSVYVMETSRNIPLVASLTDYKQILPHISELREAYRAKGRERRYLRAFRAQHFDFIKRYVEMKQRVAQALGQSAKVPAVDDR